MMQSLPSEVLEKTVLFAGKDVKDLGRYAQVCRSFRKAESAPHIYKSLASAKYGHDVASASIPFYAADWKALMIDDNKRGATPTLNKPIVCNYKYNRTEYFFCCIVKCVKWARQAQEIRVYIDVRGETDLRHPMGSSLSCVRQEQQQGRRIIGRRFSVPRVAMTIRPTQFTAEAASTARHFKGYLSFPVNQNGKMPYGKYKFCYANADIEFGTDYHLVDLFKISNNDGGGLAEPFRLGEERVDTGPEGDTTTSSVSYTSISESPFDEETPEQERERWKATVPADVMDRSDSWYV